MWLIRLARATTCGDHLVAGGDEPRNQIGADVAGGADDDDSDGGVGWRRSRCTVAEKSMRTG
jgi:hypothetical protein